MRRTRQIHRNTAKTISKTAQKGITDKSSCKNKTFGRYQRLKPTTVACWLAGLACAGCELCMHYYYIHKMYTSVEYTQNPQPDFIIACIYGKNAEYIFDVFASRNNNSAVRFKRGRNAGEGNVRRAAECMPKRTMPNSRQFGC